MSADSIIPPNPDPYGSPVTLHPEKRYISISQEIVQRNFLSNVVLQMAIP